MISRSQLAGIVMLGLTCVCEALVACSSSFRADVTIVNDAPFDPNDQNLHAEVGYVTPGFNYKDTLTIHANTIDLTSAQASK
jgi:hypothetical protein